VNPVRAVCFDLLSALLDSWTLWDAVAAELGVPAVGRAWRRRYLVRTASAGEWRPYLDVVAEAAEEIGLPESAARVLEERWDSLQPWPDVPQALQALRVPRAVVTNCSEALGRRAVARVGVPFAVVVTAERAGAYKPDPRPYRLTCAELGCQPEDVAYVAGSPFDARGALAQDFRVTWVNRLGTEVPSGLERAEIVDSLADWHPAV
jgi:2-haloalkanoic acid dehalogenase type II